MYHPLWGVLPGAPHSAFSLFKQLEFPVLYTSWEATQDASLSKSSGCGYFPPESSASVGLLLKSLENRQVLSVFPFTPALT